MLEIVLNSLKKGLAGAHSHINPLKAINELDISIDQARQKIEGLHSIWEILFHLVFWQDIFIENIKGNDAKWDDKGSWPTEEHLQKDENFQKLKERFIEGLKEVEVLIEEVNLKDRLPFWHNNPVLQFIVILITHNSYHIGQIMILKNILKTQT